MDKSNIISNFLDNSSGSIELKTFIINLLISFILSSLLGYFYTHYGRSLSNRRSFSYNFSIITMTTMVIISIVKSSLALSLGLVGALSIVRFRTAIKEPEELAYMFLCIAIGLGMGANQLLATISGFLFIIAMIFFQFKQSFRKMDSNINLIISSSDNNKIDFKEIIEIIKSKSYSVDLKRLSEDQNHFESAVNIGIKDYSDLIELKNTLIRKYPEISVNFIDNSGLFS